jgi:O-antigen ligase
VGPGWRRFAWTAPDGRPRVARYAHNEYLQVLAELGVVGLGLVLTLLAALGRLVWKRSGDAASPQLRAGAAAGLAAWAVHAAVDFGWHVPAVALTGAVLVGFVHPPKEDQ